MSAPKHHPFHLVDLSPWPILTSFSLLFLAAGGVLVLHDYPGGIYVTFGAALALVTCMYNWWKDVVSEGLNGRHHTLEVQNGLRIGMGLFIISEMMFFAVFFGSFFKASLLPVAVLDGAWPIKEGIWPPAGIKTFDPWELPLFGTLILLLSGTTVTWAHHAIKENNQKDTITALKISVLLGLTFTLCQAYEYHHAEFKFNDGIYGANFYLTTGFHGLHVLIGTLFLFVCLIRARRGHFVEGNGHLGFEFAAWYWHFVDVVWLFLFVFVYIWGR